MSEDLRRAATGAGCARSALGGAACGVGVGALAGLLDLLRSAVGPWVGFPPSQLGAAILWYGALGGSAGLIAGAVLGRVTDRAGPITVGLLIAGAAFGLAAATVNLTWLPGYAHPVSIGADLALGAGAFLLFRRLARRDSPWYRPAAWGIAACAVVVLSLATRASAPDVSEADSPPRSVTASHPSVLLVVVDSLRARNTSLHGYQRDTTPNLSGFAERALVYENARVPSSWTKPSMASMLTGLPPGVHRVDDRQAVLPDEALTVAEVLHAAGYATALFSDNPYVSSKFGFSQGFDRVFSRFRARRETHTRVPRGSLLGQVLSAVPWAYRHLVSRNTLWSRTVDWGAPVLTTEFLAWLDERSAARPWFAQLHYMEPHYPYAAPGAWNEMYTDRPRDGSFVGKPQRGVAPFEPGVEVTGEHRDGLLGAYDGEIAWWDRCFADLVAALETRGLIDDLVVVVTSDHGEGFYEHRTWEHQNSLHDELLHVPLVVRIPGGATGRNRSQVSLLGLAESLLVAAGFEPPPSFAEKGQSFVPAPREDRALSFRSIYNGVLSLSTMESGTKWILSRRGREELLQSFDVRADPGELRNLAPGLLEAGEEVRKLLLAREVEEGRRRLPRVKMGNVEAVDEALRGLGYLR